MEKPTIKRKEREKEARRIAILHAAARVFSRKNFGEATLDEIAAEAELAKGTLYNYFNDKHDLFVSLMEHGHEHFIQCISDAIAKSDNLTQMIRNLITDFLNTLFEHRYMVRMILTSGICAPDGDCFKIIIAWHQKIESAQQIIADAFGRLPESKSSSEVDRRTAAMLIIAAARYIFLTHVKEGIDDSLKEEIENYTRFISKAFITETTA